MFIEGFWFKKAVAGMMGDEGRELVEWSCWGCCRTRSVWGCGAVAEADIGAVAIEAGLISGCCWYCWVESIRSEGNAEVLLDLE